MEITKIRIARLNEPLPAFGKLNDEVVAFISVCFSDVFIVHGIKLIMDINGDFFIDMPKTKHKSIKKDIFHCIDNNFRLILKNAIINEYINYYSK